MKATPNERKRPAKRSKQLSGGSGWFGGNDAPAGQPAALPTMYAFTVPGIPQPKERARFSRKSGTHFTPERTRSYENKVKLCALACRVKPIQGEVSMSLRIYLPDRRHRDADNIAKSICDGLNGIAYKDDSQVKEGHWSVDVDKLKPRVEVWICSRTFKTIAVEVDHQEGVPL